LDEQRPCEDTEGGPPVVYKARSTPLCAGHEAEDSELVLIVNGEHGVGKQQRVVSREQVRRMWSRWACARKAWQCACRGCCEGTDAPGFAAGQRRAYHGARGGGVSAAIGTGAREGDRAWGGELNRERVWQLWAG
jgi:hypothetical protein